MMSLAKTKAWLEIKPTFPGQNLVEVMVGLLIMNESVSFSKVAVVSIPYTFPNNKYTLN